MPVAMEGGFPNFPKTYILSQHKFIYTHEKYPKIKNKLTLSPLYPISNFLCV